MDKKWEENEIEILKTYYSEYGSEYVAKILNRSSKSVMHKANRIGLSREKRFSEADDDWIKNNFENCDRDVVMRHFPNFKWEEIEKHAYYLGIHRSGVSFGKFSEYEDEIIKAHYGKMKTEDLIKTFLPNTNKKRIQYRAKQLGIKFYPDWTNGKTEKLIQLYGQDRDRDIQIAFPEYGRTYLKNKMKKFNLNGGLNRKYTNDEKTYISENYKFMSDKELGETLHRTETAIKSQRCKMNLHREVEVKSNYTNLTRFLYINNENWREESKKKWNFCCAISGCAEFEIHHIVSVSNLIKILFNELDLDNDFDINQCDNEFKKYILNKFLEIQSRYPLGICLCKEEHHLFHSEYGYGYNDEQQFHSFLLKYHPDKLNYLK